MGQQGVQEFIVQQAVAGRAGLGREHLHKDATCPSQLFGISRVPVASQPSAAGSGTLIIQWEVSRTGR